MEHSRFDRRAFLKSVLATGTRASVAGSQAIEGRFRIWDVHSHLLQVRGATPEERITELLKFADRMGIERLILSLGYPLLTDPPPEQLREENDQVLRALRRYPDRTYGFVYLNPSHVKARLQAFAACVRDGQRA